MNTEPLAVSFSTAGSLTPDDSTALLGGKGASLVAMTAAGLPVPPGFTLTTEACRAFLEHGWTDAFDLAIEHGVAELETLTGKRLGSTENPLLVSVRSGAETSMPGMLDTVLNVGMSTAVERALASISGDQAFAIDTHRRAMIGFAQLVLGATEEVLAEAKASDGSEQMASVLERAGVWPPDDPMDQVKLAVRAVFESWSAPRAVRYREIEGIDPTLGTAATVQSMVFGNLGRESGTGVAFSRNPTTGHPGLMGDFLPQAQGEDVVAGTELTLALEDMAIRWPSLHAELVAVAAGLERQYRDLVDVEFTVERGRLWLLQARRGKRSPIAAFRVAIDMANDPDFDLDRAEAVARCRRYFDDPPIVADRPAETLPVIAEGLGASPGRASGVLCLDPDEAMQLQERGVELILARRETSPADVHGMAASKGLFTTRGGQVSHAALVAREWGLPAVVGASEAQVVDGAVVGPGGRVEVGTVVTVDGDAGTLLLGRSTQSGVVAPEVLTVMSWAGHTHADQRPPDGHRAPPDRRPVRPPPADEAVAETEPSSDLGFRVMHALRIKGMTTVDTIAAMTLTDPQLVSGQLDQLVEAGLATFMEPRQMWLINAEGRTAHQPRLASAVEGLDLTGLPYERFLGLNDNFKQLCTDWQVRAGQPNDHSDAAYDDAIVDRLISLDDQAQPVIGDIGEMVGWMASYGPRLVAARQRMVDGDQKALTGVMCESYHDIWMELHEDLILTQGIDRAVEGST